MTRTAFSPIPGKTAAVTEDDRPFRARTVLLSRRVFPFALPESRLQVVVRSDWLACHADCGPGQLAAGCSVSVLKIDPGAIPTRK